MTPPSELYPRDRIGRAQDATAQAGLDALLLTPGADLRYLTGYDAVPLERLTCLVLPADGDPVLVVPLLERPAAGRPLRLVAVIVGFANGLGQIEFRGSDRLVGKGAIDCETRKVVAIGLGAEHERMAPLCAGRRACARHWG